MTPEQHQCDGEKKWCDDCERREKAAAPMTPEQREQDATGGASPPLGTGPVATIAKATPCAWTPRKPGHPWHKSCLSEGACVDRAYVVAVALREAGYLASPSTTRPHPEELTDDA